MVYNACMIKEVQNFLKTNKLLLNIIADLLILHITAKWAEQ